MQFKSFGIFQMYAYNLLHENLLCHLCTRFAALIEKMRMSSAEQVRWQVSHPLPLSMRAHC